MSISRSGSFQREGKVGVVAALLLALLGLMYGRVGGSRFMRSSESAGRANLNVLPAPLDHGQVSPPPPKYVQFPPRHHHHHSPHCAYSPPLPPSVLSPPSVMPLTLNSHMSPPLPLSPPSDEDQMLHGRRLLNNEHIADPNSSNHGEMEVVTRANYSSKGKGLEATPYNGHIPTGAPSPYSNPSPMPAPFLASRADEAPSNNLPALPSQLGDNRTMEHTTMVSAMKAVHSMHVHDYNDTENIDRAGTTADVNVEFFNKVGDTILFVNLKSQNCNFNRGATDTFTILGDCVQDICKMRLSHDDSGPSPGWFVNTVTVSLVYRTHVFNVFEWLAKDEPPYSLSRTTSSC